MVRSGATVTVFGRPRTRRTFRHFALMVAIMSLHFPSRCQLQRHPIGAGRRLGVTLVETIMVVTLLAAAAIAGGFMLDGQWLSRRSATDVTIEVSEALRTARNTAMMNQTVVSVRHDQIRGREILSIIEQAGPMRMGKRWEIDLGDKPAISGAPTEIFFKPIGSADRALEWKIVDGSTAGLVLVTPVDGNVTHKLP